MLERLNAHRAWANGLYLGWFRDLPGSPAVDGALPGECSSEGYCLKLISHVIRTEFVWLARLGGEVPGPVIWDTLPLRELEGLAIRNDGLWLQVMDSDLARIVPYRRFNGDPCESTVADIAMHACVHGTCHRAQIAARGAARDGLPKAPVTDYIAFAPGWSKA